MAKSDPKETAKRVLAMFSQYPSTASISGEKMQQMLAAYAALLRDFPSWAIEAALATIARSGGAFPPSAPELRKAVEAEAAPVMREAAEIKRVLDVGVFHERSAEERAQVEAGYAELLADLKLNEPFEKHAARPLTQAEAADKLDRLREHPEPAPPVSASLRRSLGLSKREEAA